MSLLVPTDSGEMMLGARDSATFAARLTARRWHRAAASLLKRTIRSRRSVDHANWDEDQYVRQAGGFRRIVAEHPEAASKFRWRGGNAIDDVALGGPDGSYDATVVRPGGRGSRMTAFESTLRLGRLVLFGPPSILKKPGDTISFMEPLDGDGAYHCALHRGAEESEDGAAPDGGGAGARPERTRGVGLSRSTASGDGKRSIKARRRRHDPGGSSIHGRDLLVKGAFTQSRLRQMMLARRAKFSEGEIPVLLSH